MSGQKFSLSFTKKIKKKNLQPSAIRNDAPQDVKDTTEVLEAIEENVMKTDGKAAEPELVIPMITVDRLSILRRIAEKKLEHDLKQEAMSSDKALENTKNVVGSTEENTRALTLEEQAEAAILEESKKKLDQWTERGIASNMTIPQTVEEDYKSTESLSTGKESNLEDYEKVDVSVFGAALLRGMGWQKSEGVGRMNKKVVEIIDPSSKTFGHASMPGEAGKKPGENLGGNQEELFLAKGSFVFIHSGRNRGSYGVVESLDEDHLLLRTAVGQEVIREVELNIRVVPQKEYKDSSRVINKDMYDKFKEEEARKNQKNKSKSSRKTDSSRDNELVEIEELDLTVKKSHTTENLKLEIREEVTAPSKEVNIESSRTGESENDLKNSKNTETKRKPRSEDNSDHIETQCEKDRHTERDRKYEAREENKIEKYRKYEAREQNKSEKDRKYEARENKSEKDRKYEAREQNKSDKDRKYEVKEQSKSDKDGKYEAREQNKSDKDRKYEAREQNKSEKDRKYEARENISSSDKYYERSKGNGNYRSYHDAHESKSGHENKYREKHRDSSDGKYHKKDTIMSESTLSKKREQEINVYYQEKKKPKTSCEQKPEIPWVRENLRVRLINKEYKGGRYHKEKIIVVSVETAESCECVTDEGKTLREVHPAWLETVIPKAHPQIIMIVKGRQNGQKGRILQLHKDQEKASVQLLDDTTVILKLHYDDICEYVSRY